jgi:carboxylate-amine ligase
MVTVGVEEEFLLLGPDGAVVPSAPYVCRLARAEDIRPGFLAFQLTTTTAMSTGLDDLRRDLSRLRTLAGDAARRAGVSLVSIGAPPYAAGPLTAVTDEIRFQELAGRFPDAVLAGGTCGCRVTAAVPDRDLGVEVLSRIRPWLPALLALTVNSPYGGSLDTGWASYRYHLQQRWPTFRPPGAWAGAARYDDAVRSLIASGAALDEDGVYFLARLPAGRPAVEIRVADTCLTVEDTVFYAGVVRALVATLVEDARRNIISVPVPTGVVDEQLLTAAHGRMRFRQGSVARLIHKIGPALGVSGDADEIFEGLERLRQNGTGADRQRRAGGYRRNPGNFVRFLTDMTIPSTLVHK